MPEVDFSIAGRPVRNVFQLIGEDEDDITVAIAWSLKRCPAFLHALIARTGGPQELRDRIQLLVHRHEKERGITDLEIMIPNVFHLIIEAKRGWILPGAFQIEKYAGRESFKSSRASIKQIVTLSECSDEYAKAHAPPVRGISVRHISWADIIVDATHAAGESGHIEKRILHDLINYLRTAMTQQDRYSNLVYVVSLGSGCMSGWSTTWIDIVAKHRRYFHPLGGSGWPKVPPTYLGVRYHGRLQSIHFVEKYEVVTNLAKACPSEPSTPVKPHYLYTLGPAIAPPKTVVNGDVYPSGRVWCAIDTLLTCDSVSQARDVTKERGISL